MPRLMVVGIADCASSADTDVVLTTYALGSCIAVAAWDPCAKVGGLLHFLLPDSKLESARGQGNPFLYADTGVPRLIQSCVSLGAEKSRLVIFAAGGAQVLAIHKSFQVGARNREKYRQALLDSGLTPQAEALGGSLSRSLKLEVATGRCIVREGVTPEVELSAMVRGRR